MTIEQPGELIPLHLKVMTTLGMVSVRDSFCLLGILTVSLVKFPILIPTKVTVVATRTVISIYYVLFYDLL